MTTTSPGWTKSSGSQILESVFLASLRRELMPDRPPESASSRCPNFNALRGEIVRLPLAAVVLFAALVITLYALWIGGILWFVTGRFGILRNANRTPIATGTIAAGCVVILEAATALDGASIARCGAIALCASGGVIVWINRNTVIAAIKSQRASPPRQTDATRSRSSET
jgi:hypothetical protein